MDQFVASGQCLSMPALFARGKINFSHAWMLTSVVKTLARIVRPATSALAVHTARQRLAVVASMQLPALGGIW